MNQDAAGVLIKEGRGSAGVASLFGEDGPKLNFQRIVARAVGMLIRQGLLVRRKQVMN
jgi:hypothetical protein